MIATAQMGSSGKRVRGGRNRGLFNGFADGILGNAATLVDYFKPPTLIELLVERPRQAVSLSATHAPAASQAEPLTGLLVERLKEIPQEIKTTLIAIYKEADDSYQTFMVAYVDPLLGRARSQQLHTLTAGNTTLMISDYEKAINRNIAIAVGTLTGVLVASTLYPRALILVIPIAIRLSLPIYQKGYQSIVKQRRVNYHVLASVNTTLIWVGGFFVPAALGSVLYFVAEKLLVITQDRSYKGLTNIFGQAPRSVWVAKDGIEIEIPFTQLEAGDIVVINAGQMIPVDGIVSTGVGAVDQHMLTGEAQPIEKTLGDAVFASTIVLVGKLLIEVQKTGKATVAAQIGNVLNRTASYQMSLQSKGSALAHKSALPTLLTGGLAWALIGMEQGVAVLSSAFGLNIRMTSPIAMLNFLNITSHNGILVKDGRSLELLSAVNTVVFDKTGTLTLEQPHVVQVHTCADVEAQALLRYAAAAEHRQAHPIAKAIVSAAALEGVSIPAIDEARYEIGYGIKVTVEEHLVRVGSTRFMTMEGLTVPASIEAQQTRCHAQGHSLVLVAVDDAVAGAIELQPTLRPEAQAVIKALHQRGLTLAIISGDQEEPTRRLAQELGIEQYFANTLPEDKARLVEQLQQAGRSVCFVGDGINDSIALKKANVSISLSGATTVAMDTAQVVLMDQSLKQLPHIFQLADEFNRNLKAGFISAIVPGLLNIGVIFLFHGGIYSAMAIANLALLNNIGIAMWPLYRHRDELNELNR